MNAAANTHVSSIVLSGGDPMYEKNIGEIYKICFDLKNRFPEKNIILYTGSTVESIIKEGNPIRLNILRNVNFVIDGSFIQEKKVRGIDLRGSYNQRCFSVKPIAGTKDFQLRDYSARYFTDLTEEDRKNFGNRIII